MSKAFTSGDVETAEVVRPLPVGRRPLTHRGLARGQQEMRRLLAEREKLAARRKTDDTLERAVQANARAIAYLERRLTLSDIAPRPRPPIERASLGVQITVRDEDTDERIHYTLVGPDEVDATLKRVSPLSPIGQALLGRRVGERAFLKRPKGIREVIIETLSEEDD